MSEPTPRRWLGALAIALLALASSAMGIVNGFTYDDRYVVELNPFARNMYQWWLVFARSYWPRDWGGDGYRPLTVLAFKIESTIGGGAPVVFHAANILLYALVAVLVLALARRMLPDWAAWLTAALFAVHPVHVEAVANVVGQSELLVAVFLLPALTLYVDARRKHPSGAISGRAVGVIALLYVAACFSKEHGVVLPALLVAAELTIIDDRRTWREKVETLRPLYLGLTALALAFIAVRARVLSDHGIGGFAPFTPFSSLHLSWFGRVLTALGVVPQWLRLFYWPVHLSAEYGPPAIDIAQRPSFLQLPGLCILGATLAFAVLLRRRQPAISFGIAFVCVTLLPSSNFILPAGIVLAERTLFLPSVGALLVLASVVVLVRDVVVAEIADARRTVKLAQAALAMALVAGIVRSESRTRVWHDNDRLFRQMVLDAPDAYRAHYMLGAWDFERNRKYDGVFEYRKALSLFPYDPFLAYNLAEQYRVIGMCGPAVPLYRWSRALDPNFPLGRIALARCLIDVGKFDEARTVAMQGLHAGIAPKLLQPIIATADSARSAETSKTGPVALAGSPSKLP